MIEKLYPLTLPPGLKNNGTALQSKDRWYKGSLVRFFQDTVQPVGGWVKRTLTGATITGVPNAAVSWQTNDGSAFLAIGTTLGLYVVTSGNVVYDISPTPGNVATPITWQLRTFGSYLIGQVNLANQHFAVPGTLYWPGTTAALSTPATFTHQVTAGPSNTFGMTVTPERFLVLLRGIPLTTAGGIALPPTGTQVGVIN